MALKEVKTSIRNKYDLEVNWMRAEKFVPMAGELVIYGKEIDPETGEVLLDADSNPLLPSGRLEPFTYDRFKIGDGKTKLNNLNFVKISSNDTFLDSVISCGTIDPDTATGSKFYFKYSE